MEQRSHPRFEVDAPCRVNGLGLDCQAVTENISRMGLLVRFTDGGSPGVLPAIGEILTVDVELRTNRHFGQKYLRCRGAVVRVSSARRSVTRIALSVSQMEFIDRLRQRGTERLSRKSVEKYFAKG